MNSKGQAALEYLMTYGWALVIIVIVAGILFFIAVTPQGGIVCNSSDPTKIVVQSYNITKSGGPNKVVLSNGTGGTITSYSYICGPCSSAAPSACPPATLPTTPFTKCGAFVSTSIPGTTMPGGTVVSIDMNLSVLTNTGALDNNSGITFAYTDQFGYTKSALIRCVGTPV